MHSLKHWQADKEALYWKRSYWELSKRYSSFLDSAEKFAKRQHTIPEPKDKNGVRESDKYGK